VDLVRLEVGDDGWQLRAELVDKRRGLARLVRDELALALLRDLQVPARSDDSVSREGWAPSQQLCVTVKRQAQSWRGAVRVARHVLHARVELVHELEQLVHDRLEELPVRAQEPRVLADDIPEREEGGE
jgi:hypothetical protein